MILGFGNVDILPNTLLNANDASVVSKPDPVFSFLTTSIFNYVRKSTSFLPLTSN